MIVGVCRVTIHIPGSRMLKDRRRVVRSLKDRIRHKFNASVAEVDDEELWQKAVLGIACVSGDKEHAAGLVSAILNLIKDNGEVFILDSQTDFL